jgi:hypothetical protein
MYVVTDKRRLGDRFLKAEEQYHRLREENDSQLQKYREHDQEELKNEAMREGKRMHSSDLVARIRRIVPHIQVRKGAFEGFLTLWVPNPAPEFQNDEKRGCQYLQAAFREGWLPEFIIVHVDEQNLIKSAQDGGIENSWRTILIRLLQFNVVSWKQVIEEFGDATGIQANRWRQATQRFRI